MSSAVSNWPVKLRTLAQISFASPRQRSSSYCCINKGVLFMFGPTAMGQQLLLSTFLGAVYKEIVSWRRDLKWHHPLLLSRSCVMTKYFRTSNNAVTLKEKKFLFECCFSILTLNGHLSMCPIRKVRWSRRPQLSCGLWYCSASTFLLPQSLHGRMALQWILHGIRNL